MGNDYLKYIIVGLIIVFLVFPLFKGFLNTSSQSNFEIWQGKPKIWYCDRVLIINKENFKPNKTILSCFLNTSCSLLKLGKEIEPFPVEYSCRPDVGRCFYNGKVCFKHAVKGNGYIIEWGMYFCHNKTEIKFNCKPKYCIIYFTGIGCPHCALTDPYLFYGILEWSGRIYRFPFRNETVIIEYEIYHEMVNSKVFENYLRTFNLGPLYAGVPHVFINPKKIIVGDIPILENLSLELENAACILPIK